MSTNEVLDFSFPQAPMMSLTWIPHSPSSSSSAYRFLTHQASAYSSTCPDTRNLEVESSKRKHSNRKVFKATYKHIPHKDKPPHLVAKRNARERKRVQAVNSAFAKLRKCVPLENRNKRLSKVKTLHRAIEYINGLQAMLNQADNQYSFPSNTTIHYARHRSDSSTSQEENQQLDDEEDEEDEMQEFNDYLESDIEVVNKENESRGWTTVSTACEPYWSCIPYHGEFGASIPS